ncbi:hypothetical protein DdX_07567 [Ditylenchus destructor]|uniref:Uncharacterized protein n=1 Tax=Ditylenchus destructor TaxID=166010 RepID=A0AAD4R8H3_9BILA|nr:hypothetical protein DdX_07567 [Ditylenchus destructor]
MLSPSMREGVIYGYPQSPMFMFGDERSEQTLACVTPEPICHNICNPDFELSPVRQLDYTHMYQDTGTRFDTTTEYGSSNGNLSEGDNENRCDNHSELIPANYMSAYRMRADEPNYTLLSRKRAMNFSNPFEPYQTENRPMERPIDTSCHMSVSLRITWKSAAIYNRADNKRLTLDKGTVLGTEIFLLPSPTLSLSRLPYLFSHISASKPAKRTPNKKGKSTANLDTPHIFRFPFQHTSLCESFAYSKQVH